MGLLANPLRVDTAPEEAGLSGNEVEQLVTRAATPRVVQFSPEITIEDLPNAAKSYALSRYLNLGRSQRHPLYWSCKRAFDIVLAAGALLLLAPVLVVIAIAIKVESPGTIFFRQIRVGERLFPIFKFRTMFTDAGSRPASVWDPKLQSYRRLMLS